MAARRTLARGGWQERAPAAVLRVEKQLATVSILLLIVSSPLWLLLLMMSARDGMSVLLGAGAGAAGLVLLPLLVAEGIRRRWRATRARLQALVEPWGRPIPDPRWADVQILLLQLHGPDPEASQAEAVRQLTRALADAFSNLARLRTSMVAASALGEEGAEPLVALYTERRAAIDRALADLKRACADAFRGEADSERAAIDLLADLRARTGAGAETAQAASARAASRRAADRSRRAPEQ